MGSCALVKWSICDGGCVEHRLLHRCPLRNLLINSMVYVLGKTSLCQRKRRQLGVKDGDGETGGWAEGFGGWEEVTQFSGEMIEHDSNKNKMLRPSARAATGSVWQNFAVTLWGSGAIFDSPFLFFCLLSCSSVDWLQVSIYCIRCHHTGGEVGWGGNGCFLSVYFRSLRLWRICARIVFFRLACLRFCVHPPAASTSTGIE